MTSALWKNTNTPWIIESFPNKMIELMILKFGDNFVWGIWFNWTYAECFCFDQSIINNFSNFEFLLVNFDLRFLPYFSEFSVKTNNLTFFNSIYESFSFISNILWSLNWNCLWCFKHWPNNVSSHWFSCCHKTNFSFYFSGQ